MPINMLPDILLISHKPRRLNLERNTFTTEVKVNHQMEAPTKIANNPKLVCKIEVWASIKVNLANTAIKRNIISGFAIVKASDVIKSCK